jgi:hypothetical protein
MTEVLDERKVTFALIALVGFVATLRNTCDPVPILFFAPVTLTFFTIGQTGLLAETVTRMRDLAPSGAVTETVALPTFRALTLPREVTVRTFLFEDFHVSFVEACAPFAVKPKAASFMDCPLTSLSFDSDATTRTVAAPDGTVLSGWPGVFRTGEVGGAAEYDG